MGRDDTSMDKPAHESGTRKGEEITQKEGKEKGRKAQGTSHANRPAGGRDARDSTGINPEDFESTTDGPTIPPA